MHASARHRAGACGIDRLGGCLVFLGLVDGCVGGGIDHDAWLEIGNDRRTALRVGQVSLIAAQGGDVCLSLQLRRHLPGFAKDEDHALTPSR